MRNMGTELIQIVFWVHFRSSMGVIDFVFMIFQENKILKNNLWWQLIYEKGILVILDRIYGSKTRTEQFYVAYLSL